MWVLRVNQNTTLARSHITDLTSCHSGNTPNFWKQPVVSKIWHLSVKKEGDCWALRGSILIRAWRMAVQIESCIMKSWVFSRIYYIQGVLLCSFLLDRNSFSIELKIGYWWIVEMIMRNPSQHFVGAGAKEQSLVYYLEKWVKAQVGSLLLFTFFRS